VLTSSFDEDEMGGACRTHGRDEKYNILVGKTERERLLGKSRRRWKNVRMDPKERSWVGVAWIHLAQDRDQWRAVVNMVMNLRVPEKMENLLTS
jgi:hypothetical protein